MLLDYDSNANFVWLQYWSVKPFDNFQNIFFIFYTFIKFNYGYKPLCSIPAFQFTQMNFGPL